MSVIINGTTGIITPATTSDQITTGQLTTDDITVSGASFPGVLQDENRIINGAFDFWQRTTSTSSDNAYAADRWMNNFTGGTMSYSRQTFTNGVKFGRNTPQYFARASAVGGAGSANFAMIQQAIEDVRTFSNETITIFGWAKRNSGAGNMAIGGWQYFGLGGSPSANEVIPGVQVPLTANWEPFAVQLSVPDITGKTIGTTVNTSAVVIGFWLSAGSLYNTYAASLGQQTIEVDLWGIHMRRGAHTVDAIDFYTAPEFGPELRRCQRYFQIIGESQFNEIVLQSYASGAGTYYFPYPLPTTMWKTPAGTVTGSWGTSNVSSFTISPSRSAFRINVTIGGAGNFLLQNTGANSQFWFDAEF